MGDCIEFYGCKTDAGYGRLSINGKAIAAHRAAYRLFNGKIPRGMHVCHTCDNPSCINPEHLFVGTQSDNMTDCSNKGRLQNQNIGKTHCHNGHRLAGGNLGRKNGNQRYCVECNRTQRRDSHARMKTDQERLRRRRENDRLYQRKKRARNRVQADGEGEG